MPDYLSNYTGGGLGLTSPPPAPTSPEASPQEQLGLGTQAPAYPQEWIDTYNQQSPGTQAAISQRYSGMSPDQIMTDWNTNVAPQYAPGTDPGAILAGTGTPAGTPAGGGPYPQSWIDTYNQQTPETQSAIASRYGGMNPNQIMSDWNTNVAPRYAPGTDPNAILGGTAPMSGSTPIAYPPEWGATYNALSPDVQAAVSARYGGMTPEQIMADWRQNIQPLYPSSATPEQILAGMPQLGTPSGLPGQNTPPGARGTLSGAMQQTGSAPTGPSAQPGTNLMSPGAKDNNWVNGYGSHEQEWEAPYHDNPMTQGPKQAPVVRGQTGGVLAPGYERREDGVISQWNGGTPPGPSYTLAGQNELKQPFTAGGQPFTGLQGLLDFMAVSTPEGQAIKRLMEQKDDKGGSLEPGESTLFNQFAPYLGSKVNEFPTGATPFTNWDPVGLLKLLKQAGIIGG